MSFLYKDRPAIPPVGSIIQYFGTDEPDGWIICDGATKTSNDNRFAALATHLNGVYKITTNTSNSCKPPDLRGKFLYGKVDTVDIGSTSGDTSKTISVANLPSHTHTLTDGQHTHGASSASHTHDFTGTAHTHTATDYGHTHVYYTATQKALQTGHSTECYYSTLDAKTTNIGYASITVSSTTAGGTNTGTAASVTVNSASSNISIASTGSGIALDIMPPYAVINHIMKY